MAKKRVTKRRRSGLKLKSTAKKLFKRVFKMSGGADEFNDFKPFDARINKLAYCAVSIITESPQKVLYLTKFPPASGTSAPNKNETKDDKDLNLGSTRDEKFRFDFDYDFEKATVDVEYVKNLKEKYENFWSSSDSKQKNKKWKGGKWGEENLTLTSEKWLPGAFLSDKLQITPIKKGSIPYGKDFDNNPAINKGTEDHVWSVKVSVGDKEYNAYLTENIMPQKATDILVFMKIGEVLHIQMLKRGDARNVDMKERYIPGAGEHLEPGENDKKDKKKPDIAFWRSLREEMGITPKVLTDAKATSTKIEVINSAHKDKGKEDNIYDSEGRDPRYWTFDIEGNVCGIKRGSSSKVYALYIHSENTIDSKAKDGLEVQSQKWFPVDEVLTWGEDKFMIEDHKQMIEDAKKMIDANGSNNGEQLNMDFKVFSPDEIDGVKEDKANNIKGIQGILDILDISKEDFNKEYLLEGETT